MKLHSGGRSRLDEWLRRRAARGSPRAYVAIHRRHVQGLYRYCLVMLGGSQSAEAALGDTMLRAVDAFGEDDSCGIPLRALLFRLAHEEVIKTLHGCEGPLEPVDQQPHFRQLFTDLEGLPEDQRGALLMRELIGLPYEEIGQALERSREGAERIVYEARRTLATQRTR